MWELDHKEDWALKIDAFELWCWKKLLRVPWTASRSNQSILNEISPEYSLKWLMLKLKLPNIRSHLMWRANSLGKTLMLGKSKGRMSRGRQEFEMVGWHHQLNGYEPEQTLGDGEGQKDREAWCAAVHGVSKSWTRVSDWTTTKNEWGYVLITKNPKFHCLNTTKVDLFPSITFYVLCRSVGMKRRLWFV